MKRLVINADDFGLTHGCDRAIHEAMQAGIVTSASCLVWGGRDRGIVPAGVHLRLTDGVSLLDGRQFPASRQAVAENPPDLEWVRQEWSAQIRASFEAATIWHQPTHLDTHRHTHSIPGIDQVYADLCVETGCAGVPLSDRQRDELRARGVRCADYAEIRWTDGQYATLAGLLARDFDQHETVHLMCHPGYVDDDLRRVSGMIEVRERELRVLLSPEFRAFLDHEQIELIGMDQLPAVDPLGKVDIIFLAWNRPEFSQASLRALAENTDWSRVRRLTVYTDGDAMREGYVARAPIPLDVLEYDCRPHGGPVAVMNHYLAGNPAAWFAKIDNDTMVPPGWLNTCLETLARYPSIDLLGIEAIHPLPNGREFYQIEPAPHIGGIGLMRSSAFRVASEPMEPHGRNGFSFFQSEHPEVTRGWLKPSLPVFLLDRLPIEPWRSLGEQYEAAGWQRPWKRYAMSESKLWEWWKQH